MIDAILAATRLGFPADLLLKVTLVLALAAGTTLLMRRASAASRHFVWALGIAALLSLPLLALVVPRWEVPLEPAVPNSGMESASQFSTSPAEVAAAPGESLPVAGSSVPMVPRASVSPGADEPMIGSGGSGGRWVFIAFGSWALGFMLLTLRQVIGWIGTRRLNRVAERVQDPEWLGLLRDASWLLDIDREVLLLRGKATSMPMTWGTRRPAILIPAEADSWPVDRRRVVLLHEMAHVARRDCLVQTITDFACALYWFHPLAWMAARAMRNERERACDDLVLTAGERASDYAGHLLEVARSYRGQPIYSAAAIGMARPSQLEGRLLAVLDKARRRSAPGRREIIAALVIATVILVPLAAIRTVAAQGAADDPANQTLLQQLQAMIDESAGSLQALPSAGEMLSGLRASETAGADTMLDLSVEAVPGGMVTLDLPDGADLVIVGWENNVVELHAELRGPSAAETRVELTSRNGQVRVASVYDGDRRNNDGNHIFELRVPSYSNLDIANGGGNVTIEGVAGNFTGGTGGGELSLDRLSGRADLSTGGGNIRVSNSRLDGRVTTGGGNVTVSNNQGDLRGTTGGGNVRIENSGPTTTAQANQPTVIHSGGGNIDLLDLQGAAELATGGGNISVRSVAGTLTARTGGGNVRIERAAASVNVMSGSGEIALGSVSGSAVARTGSGNIRLGLTSSPEVRAVELESGSGNVTVDLPADFTGSFEVVINSRGARDDQIRSDIPLTTEVQNTNGRGVLRAVGNAGTGASRVIIRTSSGNVTIRRAGSTASRTYGATPRPRPDPQPRPKVEVAIEEAFENAFDEDFEQDIEAIVNAGLGSFTSGLVQFTADITTSALAEVAVTLEELDRAGRLTEEDRQELRELREEIRKIEALRR